MKKYIFLLVLFSVPLISFADRDGNENIYIQKKGNGGHLEHYQMADMPDVYYDSEAGEIIIEAEGISLYYLVQIVSNSTNQTVISTQVDGYGDTIDVSSLPASSYTIVITSQYLNEYEGTFNIQ